MILSKCMMSAIQLHHWVTAANQVTNGTKGTTGIDTQLEKACRLQTQIICHQTPPCAELN